MAARRAAVKTGQNARSRCRRRALSAPSSVSMASLTPIPLITRLSARVIRILGCNPGPMTLQGTNTYLVGTGHKRVLIDSGDEHTSGEYTKLLKDVLVEEKATIEHLVVTHWHHDHIGGVGAVQDLLRSSDGKCSPATVWKFSRSNGDPGGEAEEKSAGPWTPLVDRQRIEIEGAVLEVCHTPGHTSDHACLLLEEENALFSGDCILGETSAVFEDLHDYMLSLEKILGRASSLIYPGHGPIVRQPNERIAGYIEHRTKREQQIMHFLVDAGRPSPVIDIVHTLYKDTPENLWPAAGLNVTHHLEKLLKEGRVTQTDGNWMAL